METTKLSQQIHSLLSSTTRNIQAAFLIDRQPRGLKEGSLRFHSGNLNLFCNYLDRVGVVTIEEINHDIIRQYLLELASDLEIAHKKAGPVDNARW